MHIDALKKMLTELDKEVQACRVELTKPPRKPAKLQHLLALLAKRNEIVRALQSAEGR